MEARELETLVSQAYRDREQLKDRYVCQAVYEVIDLLDRGQVRVAEKTDGEWRVNAWVKEAILLYFALRPLEPMDAGDLRFYDKIRTKQDLKEQGIRVVPPGVARYGSFLEPGCVVMPGYVNIGAYVGAGTMVDTWATVGSCAQVGKGVHLSGGVGLGGVLEPPSASPVIIEDGAFIGSRCIVVEGCVVEEEAVLGANVVLTASTPIVDVTGSEPVITKGRVPARSVVIPGSLPKEFPAGTFHVPCALLIGKRTESTDKKTSLNDVLRTFNVQV
jgi:2,3,4,5-tetrahydropyridine-2-carboxylate N-succinyltransferase